MRRVQLEAVSGSTKAKASTKQHLMNPLKNILLCVLVVLTTFGSLAADEKKSADKDSVENNPAGQVLDTSGKQVKKLEVSNSFGGYRNTLIFYTFKDQQAVLRVLIDNKSKKFPVSALVYEFAADVTEDGLKKWHNNQHSDGLFPDVPNPVAKHELPAGSCKTLSHKLIDHTKQRLGEFDNYSVSIQVSGSAKKNKFRVKEFTTKATVHLKTN